jgi:hypothetical protein
MFPSAFPKKPFLYPVLDSNFSNDLVQDAMDAIRAGVEIFQIRAKNLPKNRVLRIIEQLESIAQEGHACMIVNDYVDMALVSNASEQDHRYLDPQSGTVFRGIEPSCGLYSGRSCLSHYNKAWHLQPLGPFLY